MNDETDGRALRADDPRLSEWLDGRLPAAEAAEVARSVAASPELTRAVADLRRVKGLLAAAPAIPVPAGFVADVLAALDAPPRLAAGTAARSAGGPAEPRVDAEWERIELERLADEIAEAREDAAVAETTAAPRRPWPWMTMLAALAAGLLVAALVNMPPLHSVLVEHDRDVALRGAGQPQEGLSRAVDEFFADTAADAETAAEPGKKLQEVKDRELDARLAPVPADAFAQAGPADDRKGAAEGAAPGGAGGGANASRVRADRLEAAGTAWAPSEPLVVVVRGPEGRAEFTALLAARNISVSRRPGNENSELRKRSAVRQTDEPQANAYGDGLATERGREAGVAADQAAFGGMPGGEEVIAISGSREAIGQFLAALDTRRKTLQAVRRQRTREAEEEIVAKAADKTLDAPAAPPAAAAEPPVTLLVRLVDVGPATAAAKPADPAAEPPAAAATIGSPAADPAAPTAGQSQGAGDREGP